MSKNYCNIWQEYEKYQLWIGYHMKVPNKILSQHFERSTSAINKYLIRSGIREDIFCKQKRKLIKAKIHKLESFTTLLTYCGIDTQTIKAEMQVAGKWEISIFTKDRMLQLNMNTSAPWSYSCQKANSLPRHKKSNQDLFVPIQICISFLNQHDITVVPITKHNKLGWTYTLDGKPVTNYGLLAYTNRLRILRKEPIYLIEGVTFED